MISSSGCHSLRTLQRAATPAASSPAGCRTSRFSRSASSWIVSSSSCRVRGVERRARPRAGVLTAPVMVASGVRRSCETELSSELRSRSVSIRTCACCASLGEVGALERQRDLVGEGLEQCSCSGVVEAARSVGRRPSTPTGAASSRSAARSSAAAPGSVVGAQPGQLAVLVDPAGRRPARSASTANCPPRPRRRAARRPPRLGSRTTTWLPEDVA